MLTPTQVGITLVGILSGTFGEATVAESLAGRVAKIPVLAPYAATIALAIVVSAITLLSVILGELVPKRIALRNPEGVAVTVDRPRHLRSRRRRLKS